MTVLRLGFVPLTDCAVLAVAQAKGMFARHGIAVQLGREVSWASLRDKLMAGAVDGAQLLAGMPLAAAAGIDPAAPPLLTACGLGLNGNAITLSSALWVRVIAADPAAATRRPLTADVLWPLVDADRRAGRPPLHLAMVYPFAAHHYQLRYWLAAAGIDPDHDVRLSVVPPPRMVDALADGAIDGCCVGEPWNSLAVRRGVGRIAITGYELWNNAPEKVFAVTRRFAERNPQTHLAVLRALLEASAWADAPENRDELARLLAAEHLVGAPAGVIAAALAGDIALGGGARLSLPDFHVFHRYAATFPWVSHGIWFLRQMRRWGQLAGAGDLTAIASEVYRPDLYREAASALGMLAPEIDLKREGVHTRPWALETSAGSIPMGPDAFFDGSVFDPLGDADFVGGAMLTR
ncbi:ABC transporter substrate-binding protein [bacterium]|nr:ABC transporter substrate-binding protein [bacterium]